MERKIVNLLEATYNQETRRCEVVKQRMNGWKVAFFSLLTCLLVGFIIVAVLFQRYLPEVEENHFTQQESYANEATFFIQTNKSRLNSLISSQITTNQTEIPYIVELTEEHVQLRSSFPVLGQEVPITINFQPVVASNGDLLLEVETFFVGLLRLPIDRVLQLIYEWMDLPEWVEIYPTERLVEVKMTELRIDDHKSISFRFITFDLENDRIELEMTVE